VKVRTFWVAQTLNQATVFYNERM